MFSIEQSQLLDNRKRRAFFIAWENFYCEGTAMRKISVGTVFIALVFGCLSVTLGYCNDDTSIKGMIIGRAADTITVRTPDGANQVIVLTDDTKVQVPKGLGLRKKQVSWANLIPGLRVSVKAITNPQGQLVAREINFNKDDLETASMIQAGVVPTEEKVKANQQAIAANQKNIAANQQDIAANRETIEANEKEVNQRFSDLADYEVKEQGVVYFASGRSKLAEKDKATLSQLAAAASKLPGYIVQVKGFADSTGNPAMNQTLSRDRAYAVINYLMQECNIPPRHIVSPGAMGISNPVASNETTQGRAENRRVEVKVMVNKGIAASAS